ncbi:hypothetical protein Hanom_Chr07g00635971 [Helianthus anomalus]
MSHISSKYSSKFKVTNVDAKHIRLQRTLQTHTTPSITYLKPKPSTVEEEYEWCPPWHFATTSTNALRRTEWRPPWHIVVESPDYILEDKDCFEREGILCASSCRVLF